MSYYLTLGIAPDADQQAIRKAYRALARRYHPDAGKEASPARFRMVSEAYETLGDPERRATYDRSLRRPAAIVEPLSPVWVEPISNFAPHSSIGMDAIFEEVFRLFENDFFNLF